mgnify:CR=1 FL=1
MKSMFIKEIIFGCLILLMSSCNNGEEKSAQVSVDKEQIKREIQARENEFADIYNSGELKRIGYYADDAISFYQNMPPITSQAERLEFLKPDLNSDSNKISFKTNEIFASKDGEQVLEIGSYTVVDSTNTLVGSGNYMSLFEKRDGQYVCLRDMSASDMPLEDFDE